MRRLATALIALGALAAPAGAQDQVVTGTVAPQVGIMLSSTTQAAGTQDALVTREQRGDTLYVTVIPAG